MENITKLAKAADSLHRDLVFFCSERLAEMGLTTGLMYFVLDAAKYPGCTQKELGDALGLDKAYVTRCLRKLTEDGFLMRRPHPTDGRASLLYVTPKGKEVFESCGAMLDEWDRSRLSALDEDERGELFTLLSKIQTETKGRKTV